MSESSAFSDERCLPLSLPQLRKALDESALAPHSHALMDACEQALFARRHGDMPTWVAALNALPARTAVQHLQIDLSADTVSAAFKLSAAETAGNTLQDTLQSFIPWRKGPFRIGETYINTEWRSDWKWQRIAPALSALEGRTVLDVGCGNGYHLWRLKDAGAQTVLGIDPTVLFVMQFLVFQRYVNDPSVQLLPLTLEELPPTQAFDTVLSMGVLSHRREPLQHLQALKTCLRHGGELLLETLVLPGEEDQLMNVEGRYARMRNVWQLPTVTRAKSWLHECGFERVRLVDVASTSTEEQRSTEWMPFESLANALHPQNEALTIEGHPRPCRAVLVAEKPNAD